MRCKKSEILPGIKRDARDVGLDAAHLVLSVNAAVEEGICTRAETHWKSAEEIRTLAVYEDHLARFPNCDFAALAKARIDALKK